MNQKGKRPNIENLSNEIDNGILWGLCLRSLAVHIYIRFDDSLPLPETEVQFHRFRPYIISQAKRHKFED